jgi:hypothetical protein
MTVIDDRKPAPGSQGRGGNETRPVNIYEVDAVKVEQPPDLASRMGKIHQKSSEIPRRFPASGVQTGRQLLHGGSAGRSRPFEEVAVPRCRDNRAPASGCHRSQQVEETQLRAADITELIEE